MNKKQANVLFGLSLVTAFIAIYGFLKHDIKEQGWK